MKKITMLVQNNGKFEKLSCTFQNGEVFDSNNVALDRKAAFASEDNENNGAVVTQALHSGYTYLAARCVATPVLSLDVSVSFCACLPRSPVQPSLFLRVLDDMNLFAGNVHLDLPASPTSRDAVAKNQK